MHVCIYVYMCRYMYTYLLVVICFFVLICVHVCSCICMFIIACSSIYLVVHIQGSHVLVQEDEQERLHHRHGQAVNDEICKEPHHVEIQKLSQSHLLLARAPGLLLRNLK